MTYYLRFPNETIGLAALEAAGFIWQNPDTNETQPISASHDHALDVIGNIYTGGEYDAVTGEVIIEPTLLSGWHVNFVGELPKDWSQYQVNPAQPKRVFF